MAMYQFGGGVLVPQTTDGAYNTMKELERNYKVAVNGALQTPAGTLAVQQYKVGESPEGHKVLDDARAVEALAEACGDMFPVLRTTAIKTYRKAQLFNAELRKWQEVGKDGKLTGNPGTKVLALMSKQTVTEVPESV